MIRLVPHIAVAAAHPRGPRVAAGMAAASRAVWLAGRACAETGLRRADVRLTVPDREVDAAVLFGMATMAGMTLRLLSTTDNPAQDWRRVPGRRDWRPGTLAALVEYRTTAAETAPGIPALQVETHCLP
ncbi:hypothetical protein [Nocardia sp. CC227C]|uniref:hypothetical protein n=1 Tax=Nocardia sp. CC227C TaxID=3044562 RepID=UPI00278BC6CD|nr:hypothetical protein [Nocardia sp. CC227C]